MISRIGLGLARRMYTTLAPLHNILTRPAASRQVFNASRLRQLTVLRSISTVKASHDQEQEVLVAQRRNRPTSPHLTIYQPQLTAILSSFHRITGVAMASAFYALTCGYAATTILGIPFDAGVLVSSFAALPVWAKIGAKAAMSFPFAFHIANGVRHLVWDFGKELTIKGVYRTGYVVLGFASLFGTYLTFF